MGLIRCAGSKPVLSKAVTDKFKQSYERLDQAIRIARRERKVRRKRRLNRVRFGWRDFFVGLIVIIAVAVYVFRTRDIDYIVIFFMTLSGILAQYAISSLHIKLEDRLVKFWQLLLFSFFQLAVLGSILTLTWWVLKVLNLTG